MQAVERAQERVPFPRVLPGPQLPARFPEADLLPPGMSGAAQWG